MKDSRFFYDVSNDTIISNIDHFVLELDYKIFFGVIPRHTKIFLMKDAVLSIQIRDRITRKERLITK